MYGNPWGPICIKPLYCMLNIFLRTKMADSQSEMPICSRISILILGESCR